MTINLIVEINSELSYVRVSSIKSLKIHGKHICVAINDDQLTDLYITNDAITISVAEWEGETLEMARISRLDMGAYLCIASNGIPPTVSKQIKVSVDCKYILCRFNLSTSIE